MVNGYILENPLISSFKVDQPEVTIGQPDSKIDPNAHTMRGFEDLLVSSFADNSAKPRESSPGMQNILLDGYSFQGGCNAGGSTQDAVADGTSNTIMFAEESARPKTK